MAGAWGLTVATRRPTGTGIDVGSPFEHAKSGILYVAAHLPPPGRDGTGSAEQLDEIDGLITAAGGRTLGLFSSMRAARAAAEAMRARLETPVLCQGEDGTAALVERFAADRGDLAVRHVVAVAGRRCAGAVAVAGADRSHSVSAARRSAADRAPARSVGARRQRVHGRRSQPRGAAAGPGRRPVAAARARTRASSPCWIPGWPPPATAGIFVPRFRRSGRPPTRPGQRRTSTVTRTRRHMIDQDRVAPAALSWERIV